MKTAVGDRCQNQAWEWPRRVELTTFTAAIVTLLTQSIALIPGPAVASVDLSVYRMPAMTTN